MRPLWKGSISFGLVSIPVKLYAATERKNPKFHYIHTACHTPIRYLKWCPTCNREVQPEEIGWGYEYEKGRYVLLNDEDFQSIPRPEAKSVHILDFVKLEEIDPIYFDKTYFLEPAEGGSKAYTLLSKAMSESGRIALAVVRIRTTETLAALRLYNRRVMVMETMFWPDEVRESGTLDIPAVEEPDEREVKMANMLIETLSTEFDPAKYTPNYRKHLLELIEQKIVQEETVAPEAPETRKIVDLMEALKASINEAERRKAEQGPMAAAGT